MSAEVLTHPKSSISFSPYHLKAVFYYLLTDENYQDKFFPILSPSTFISEKSLHTLALAFWKFYEKYEKFPSVTDFVEEVFVQKGKNIDLFSVPPTEDQLSVIYEFFISLANINTDIDYISDITVHVIKLASVHRVLGEYRSSITNGTVNVDELANELMNATVAANPVTVGINALSSLDKRIENRLTTDVINTVIPVGIPGFVECFEDGGVPKGTLSFFIAATSGGKSVSLITLSKIVTMYKKKVLYVSAELSADTILKRFDSAITGIPIRDLREKALLFKSKIQNSPIYQEALSNFHVVEVPIGAASTKDVESMLKQLNKKGFYPDVLVVDYADNLRSVRKYEQSRFEVYEIYKNLRRIGQENNCAVWTASQINTEGMAEAEKSDKTPSLRHVSEARAKAHVADVVIGIARSKEENDRGEARLILLKNRYGGQEGKVITVFPNFDCSLMWTPKTMPVNYTLADGDEAGILPTASGSDVASMQNFVEDLERGVAELEI